MLLSARGQIGLIVRPGHEPGCSRTSPWEWLGGPAKSPVLATVSGHRRSPLENASTVFVPGGLPKHGGRGRVSRWLLRPPRGSGGLRRALLTHRGTASPRAKDYPP